MSLFYAMIFLTFFLIGVHGEELQKDVKGLILEELPGKNLLRKLESENYIKVQFIEGEDILYANGFNSFDKPYRNDLNFLRCGGKEYSGNKQLTITKDCKYEIEIHFLSPPKSLEYFFFFFYANTKKIKSIDFSHLDSSLLKDIKGMFYGDESLDSIDFTNFKTGIIKDFSELFYGCISLSSIDLQTFDTFFAKKMNHMFYSCSGLEALDLSNFDTTLVENMDSMFSECSGLKSIVISSFDTSSVTTFSQMFKNCKALQWLDLSNFNTELVENMDNMFDSCTELRILDISGFNFQKISSLTDALANLDNLLYLDIYNIINYNTIPDEVFYPLIIKNGLTIFQSENVILTDTQTFINYDFKMGNYILMKYNMTQNYTYINGFKKSEYRNDVAFIKYGNKIYKGNEKLEINGEFNNTIEVHFLTPTESLESFFSHRFDNSMDKVISVDFTYFDSSRVKKINSIFSNCEELETIIFSNFDTARVENMDYVFYKCKALKSVDLSKFDTSLVTTMTYMFSECLSLKSLDLSYWNTSSLNSMNSMFYNSKNFESIDLSNFDTSSVTDMRYLFYSLNKVKLIDISGFNFEKITNASLMFENNCNLQYFNIKNIKNPPESIQNMFDNCGCYNDSTQEYQYLKDKENLIVCKNEDNTFFPKRRNICCNYNIKINDCVFGDNYIKVRFKKEVIYPDGFGFVEYDKSENEYRKDIDSIKLNQDNFQKNETLTIPEGSEIKIYFNYPVTSLEKFFYDYYDPNVEFILSVDLSHFNISLLESTEGMFYGCTSLESIDLSNFDAPLIKNMHNMFFHCTSLISFDLSALKSTLLTDIGSMFCGCTSLEYLNLQGFKISNVEVFSYMFYNVINLRYINIYDVEDNNIFLNELRGQYGLNDNKNLMVCQNKDLLTNAKYQYKCCEYMIEKKIRKTTYIKAKYNQDTQ